METYNLKLRNLKLSVIFILTSSLIATGCLSSINSVQVDDLKLKNSNNGTSNNSSDVNPANILFTTTVSSDSTALTWSASSQLEKIQIVVSEGTTTPTSCENKIEIDNSGSYNLSLLIPNTSYKILICQNDLPTSRVISFKTKKSTIDNQIIEYAPATESSEDYFGMGMAVYGNKMAVSMNPVNSEGNGKILTYERETNGAWEFKQTIESPVDNSTEGTASARFGIRLKMSKDLLFASDPDERDLDDENTGALYIFEDRNGQWERKQKLLSPSYLAGNHCVPSTPNFCFGGRFGYQIDINKDGSKILVSDSYANSNETGFKNVYLYSKNILTNNFQLTHTFAPPNDEEDFGQTGLAIDGEHVAISSDDSNVLYLYNEYDYSTVAKAIEFNTSSSGFLGENVEPIALDNNRLFFFDNTDENGSIKFYEYNSILGWDLADSFDVLSPQFEDYNYYPMISVSDNNLSVLVNKDWDAYTILNFKVMPSFYSDRLILNNAIYDIDNEYSPYNLIRWGNEIYFPSYQENNHRLHIFQDDISEESWFDYFMSHNIISA